MFNNRYGNHADGELENLKSQTDVKTLMFFIMLIIAGLLLIIFNMGKADSDDVPQTEQTADARAFRPTGIALRAQVSWDGNLAGESLKPGESCLTINDVGFYAPHRAPECSSADVDLWVVRVMPNDNQLFYGTRGLADTLFSATADDRGLERMENAPSFRYEQLISQYSLLPPGRYHIIADLFQPDIHQPNRNVKVCGAALFREGEPDQNELFNGCVEVSIGGAAPQTVTLASFTIDANNQLVAGSITHGEAFSLEGSFYNKSRF